jgi:FAD/FMN-containing dehydrogenase
VTHGGVTGLAGGARTGPQDIVLSLERMRRMEPVDAVNRSLVVEAGAPLQKIQEAAEQAGLLFALDFGARGSATIGGAISTNAGGNSVIRYGMAREQILGIEAVLADGTVISSMKDVIKNNTGYDLKQLFIGSEGTLGVVTRRGAAFAAPAPKPQHGVAGPRELRERGPVPADRRQRAGRDPQRIRGHVARFLPPDRR